MKTTIIIPNYNGMKFLDDCLSSLREQTTQDFQILIIDNHSEDDSVSFLKTNYPEARLIVLNRNYGFSRAVNEGIRLADTPYVLLLNNDTKADPGFVETLVSEIETSPRIFSVSSRMIQMYHPELMDSAGDNYTLLGWAVNRGVGRPLAVSDEPSDVFSACAGAAIYRRGVFSKIGLFDEHHFAYLEDVDIGYRARVYGYENIYCPGAVVYHVGSGTSGSKYNTFKVRLAARNNVYLLYKNMPSIQLFINFPFLVTGFALKYLFFIKRGFGRDYREGLVEGLRTRERCRKIPLSLTRARYYIDIEISLIQGTIEYVKDYFSRKLFRN